MTRRASTTLSTFAALLAAAAAAPAQAAPPAPAGPATTCTVDLDLVGAMEDILSNALTLGRKLDEGRVNPFLKAARRGCANGRELLQKAAVEFGLTEQDLLAEVERFRHVNCDHAGAGRARAAAADGPPLTRFAVDVTMHVVLHELGHALIREFDLPVLGNEETVADAFATHYLTQHVPERAVDVLCARVASLMHEAGEVTRGEWPVSGEHDNDARRAFQIAALATAADPSKYGAVADLVGMSVDDRKRAADYGAEVHRSWRRVLRPLWMPDGVASAEARVVCDGDAGVVQQLREHGLPGELEAIARRFDWHSQVTILFTDGAGGAGWSRSKRTVTVHGGYVRRFVAHGAAIGAK